MQRRPRRTPRPAHPPLRLPAAVAAAPLLWRSRRWRCTRVGTWRRAARRGGRRSGGCRPRGQTAGAPAAPPPPTRSAQPRLTRCTHRARVNTCRTHDARAVCARERPARHTWRGRTAPPVRHSVAVAMDTAATQGDRQTGRQPKTCPAAAAGISAVTARSMGKRARAARRERGAGRRTHHAISHAPNAACWRKHAVSISKDRRSTHSAHDVLANAAASAVDANSRGAAPAERRPCSSTTAPIPAAMPSLRTRHSTSQHAAAWGGAGRCLLRSVQHSVAAPCVEGLAGQNSEAMG